MGRFAWLLVAVSFAAAPAHAQDEAADAPATRYLVRPLGGDATPEAQGEACDAVRATLTAEGFETIDDADVAAQIAPSRFEGARRLDDLRPIASELGATAIATVTVWTSDGAPDSVTISIAGAEAGARSFSASETLAGRSLGEAARDALRGALMRQRNALLVSGSSTAVTAPDEEDVPEAGPDDEEEDARPESGPTLFGIIGPGLVAAIGAAGLGLGIFASLDGSCEARGPTSGRCLIGEEPNVGLGVLLIVGGVLGIAGAIVWWVSGASDPLPQPRLDVGFLPEGGAILRTNGTF